MFKNIFRKDPQSKDKDNEKSILTTALLIHAAKMDENFTDVELKIIKEAIKNLFNLEKKEVDNVFNLAEKREKDSNQIIEFTKKIKQEEMNFRLKILELLWEIIYSDKNADVYETNLIRRICGLLYISNKEAGDIKEKIKLKFTSK